MSNKNDIRLIGSIQKHRPAGLSTSGCYIITQAFLLCNHAACHKTEPLIPVCSMCQLSLSRNPCNILHQN